MKKIVKGMLVVTGVAAGLVTIGAVVNHFTDGAVVDGLSNLKDKVFGGKAAETVNDVVETAAEVVSDIAADVADTIEGATI